MIVLTHLPKEKIGNDRGRFRETNMISPPAGSAIVFVPSEKALQVPLPSLIKRILLERKEPVLFLAPGARISGEIEIPPSVDVAAHVTRIGAQRVNPGPFDGLGRISTSTLYFSNSVTAQRVLDRWEERMSVHGDEAVSLVIALTEIREACFYSLGPEYVWVESLHRALHRDLTPVVELGPVFRRSPRAKLERKPVQKEPRPPGVLWAGHLYDYSGYGKANREILFRVANSIQVSLDQTHQEPVSVDEYTRARLDTYKGVLIDNRAPIVRFFGPDFSAKSTRHRIVWTMMETYKIHSDMVRLINDGFDELWTPTRWNAEVFKSSGVRKSIRVMPLGVNPGIYFKRPAKKLRCRLLSGPRRGRMGYPEGFKFVTLGLPSFRKGFDVIADAMKLAFPKALRKMDVHLVLALTHSLPNWNQKVYEQFEGYDVPIWALEGKLDEHGIAEIYSSCEAYVSASRGEGWNLPVHEAAACGLPVICPDNTSHPEVVGEKYPFMFPAEGTETRKDAGGVSGWYVDVPFSKFGSKSIRALADLLRTVRDYSRRTIEIRDRLTERVRAMTWDSAAERVIRRLLEVQP